MEQPEKDAFFAAGWTYYWRDLRHLGSQPVDALTAEKLATAWEKVEQMKAMMESMEYYKFNLPPEDTPQRHKDYLPLNKWDETPDG